MDRKFSWAPRRQILAMLVLGLSLGNPGHAAEPSQKTVADKQPGDVSNATTPKPVAEKPEVMARVAGEDITVPDFLHFMMKDTRMLEVSKTTSGRAKILREMIFQQLTREAIRREGLLLNQEGPRMGAFQAAEQELMRKHYPVPPVPSETAIQEYYAAHKEELGIPEKVRVSQIQVRYPEHASSAEKKAARDKIDAALARLDKGEAFDVVAGDVTENLPLKERGGDVGFVPRNTDPWLKQALMGINTGAYTGILESPVGYEILKITDQRPGVYPDLIESHDKIVQAMLTEGQMKAREAYLRGVAKEVGVKILAPDLAAAAP